jgi:sigma-B regulation protein RsbU (phosphoserine phosphatase)
MINSIAMQIGPFIDRRRAHKELLRQDVDRRIARQIQRGLLPRIMPTFSGFNITGRSSSADEVGGDSFDFIPLLVEGQECLDVVIADVSGHGIAAALLSGQTRAYLRAFAFTYSDVGTLLNFTNRCLVTDLVTDHFVTLLLVQLNPRSRTLRYTSAGHCPGYVLDRQGQIKVVLASTGSLLGIDAASEFPTGPELTLEPGDLVFLYTDGIVEAGSSSGKPFGLERTLGIVRKHQQETPDEILEALFDAVGDFSERLLQDDLTGVIIKAESAG